jgi:hypothetical protein
MPVRFFQIPLTVRPQRPGTAELIPPKPLREMPFDFVLVRQGGEEAIVRVEAPEAELKALEKAKEVQRLTLSQMKKLRDSYSTPALKKRRFHAQHIASEEPTAAGEQGRPQSQLEVVEQTVQTVRSGFYLIDVPVSAGTEDSSE